METRTFLALSLGNTSLRWCLIRKGSLCEPGRIPVRSDIPDELKALASHFETYAASVNPKRLQRLKEELNSPVAVLGEKVPVPIKNSTRAPEEVGTDRLLAALGCWCDYGPSVVVDFGTAITVDVVTQGPVFHGPVFHGPVFHGPVFHGGAILPGPFLSLEALNAHTALLPKPSLQTLPKAVIGRDTEEAIASGLGWGTLGAVRYLIESIRRETGLEAICVTGGNESFFSPRLREIFKQDLKVDSGLVFKGIKQAVQTIYRKKG